MNLIGEDLYQFSTYIPAINLTFNQYLLLTEEPILFHTGNIHQAKALVPQLKEVLGEKELKYIFASHFEADECGGLSIILDAYPSAITICSEVTARELNGFGIDCEVLIKKPGESLNTNSFKLEFISYPSEVHLWEGILAIENTRGIFFSSDLMITRGDSRGLSKDSDWLKEIESISSMQIPNPEQLTLLQEQLKPFNPTLIATGHGSLVNLRSDIV